ncbi:MAG: Gfo/Idh/MocA family oxidoreductase [Novosphingobium sp.]
MNDKLNVAVVGMGKMGLSHFAIVNAHPAVTAIACESTGFLADGLEKYVSSKVCRSYADLLAYDDLDAVVIATPSRSHAAMVRQALDRRLNVFCEKPFCLDWRDSEALSAQAAEHGLVGQVGYHYRFVASFREMKRILDSGALGRVTQVLAEAYGPVVLAPKRGTWRTDKAEGGGSLFDYAAHPVNLLNWFFGVPDAVSGSVLTPVFSDATDDQVCATLQWQDGLVAQLAVNWSDESFRKMSTKISIIGTNGRIVADRQECQLYLRQASPALPDYEKGWTVRYTTDLTQDQWFYLRGEEYSAQIDGFVKAIHSNSRGPVENDFSSAAQTDRTLAMIVDNASSGVVVRDATAPPVRPRRNWLRRLFRLKQASY